MTYQATIRRNAETSIIKLGRCGGVSQASSKARDKCPAGWIVVDVRGNL